MMSEARRGRGKGRGRATGGTRDFERRNKMSIHGHSTFENSEDGTQFLFPTWQDTLKDPSLIIRFNTSLKWVGGYSEDEETNFCNEKSYTTFMNMQYYPSQPSRELKVNLNLTVGENLELYTSSRKRKFDNFLLWILSNEDILTKSLILDEESEGKGGKFVCNRSVLSEICIYYNNKLQNYFHATCFHGVIYLLKMKEIDTGTVHAWGSVFERMITHNQPVQNNVGCNMSYRCVLSSYLGEHRIIYSGATDCFNPYKYKEEINDCSALISVRCTYDNPKNYKILQLERYKMFNWCLGLYLSGVPEVVVGYRDYGGSVELLKLYDKMELMERGQGHWDMDCVFTFLRHLLCFVKEKTESKPGVIFQFVKKDHSNIYTCSEQGEEIIPEWFKKKSETYAVPRGGFFF